MLKTIRLRKERDKESENLNSEEKALFEEIVNQIYTSPFSLYEKELILQDILDMFIENQNSGRDVDFIVGEDYREFCEEIINSYLDNKRKPVMVLGFIQRMLIAGLIFFILVTLINGVGSTINENQLSAILIYSCIFATAKFSFIREFSKYNLKNFKHKFITNFINNASGDKEVKMNINLLLIIAFVNVILNSLGIIKLNFSLGIGVLVCILFILILQFLKISLIKSYKVVD